MNPKADTIRALVMDIDGVLTDGRIWLDASNRWRRYFSIQDGMGIRRLLQNNVNVGVITSSKAEDIRTRMQELGVTALYEGQKDKRQSFDDFLQKHNLAASQVCYIGDDLSDIPLIERSGLGATVPGALENIIHLSDYVTKRAGGYGAVREICELILAQQEQ